MKIPRRGSTTVITRNRKAARNARDQRYSVKRVSSRKRWLHGSRDSNSLWRNRSITSMGSQVRRYVRGAAAFLRDGSTACTRMGACLSTSNFLRFFGVGCATVLEAAESARLRSYFISTCGWRKLSPQWVNVPATRADRWWWPNWTLLRGKKR